MPAIIAEKQIVVKAIDKVSEPLARMDSSLASFVSKFGSLDSHMTQAATSQSTFRGALQQTKASLQETSTSATKLSTDIAHIKSKKVDIKANTTEANTKISEFDKSVKKLQPPVIKPKVDSSQATNGLNKINEKGKEVERTGHSITKSFVFGNIISNGITSITSHLGEWAKQGYEAAKAGTELTERWSNLGMSRKEIQATGQAILQIKANSNLSGNAASELVTRMYGFTGSAKQARTLAFGVATIADKMKMTTGQADSFAQSLTRIETAGNVSTRSLGRLERSAPGITKALQQASGMSAKAFNQLLSSGKMTSQQFNDILARASKNWDKYSSDWNKTADGALHHIQVSWQNTKKALMAPLVQSSASGLSALSKALDKLQPQFNELGTAIGKAASAFAKWLTPQHAEDLGTIVASLGKIVGVIAKGAWKAFSGIVQIIGKAFGAVSGHADGLDATADALDHISKNKAAMTILQGIGMVLATQFVYGKLFKMASGLGLINNGLTLLGKHKLSGNIFKDVTKGLRKLTKIKIDPRKWFAGGKNWAKSLFKEAPEEALKTGDKAGGNFITRFAAKTNSSKFARVGRSMGGRLLSGIGLAFEAYDFVKDIMGAFTKKNANSRYRSAGKAVGAGLGAGIGFFFGGPAGAALGGMIGRVIGGHVGPSFAKFGKGAAKLLGDIFVHHDWNKVWSDIGKGWKSFWKGMGNWWNKLWGKKSKSSSSTSSKEIKSLGGNHYSKTDIANIKEMNRAVRAYIRTLKTLKSTVKHNDPTKELNRMNDHLKSFAKNLSKSAKPLKSVSKTFKTFGNATKKMASSIKSLTGKHGLGEFAKDLKSLNTAMKKVKLDTYFEKLAKSIKKSKLASEFKSLTKSLKSMVKEWKGLEKPLKNNEKALTEFEKIVKKLTDKKTGLKALDTDIIDLSKDLRKYDFGKSLSRQMAEANKAVGKHGFVKEFSSMVKTVESDLKSFKKTFDNNWGRIWKNLDRDVSRGLRSALRAEDSGMDDMRSKESHFTSSFKKSWSNWLDDLVSAMRSAFDKLPGIAGKAMSGIVGRLNKGINGINKVIGDFGGDKKLGTISYARGTFAHPGGKAIVNDALTPNKTELIYQPSRGWNFARGQNVVRDLEAGSMVLDAQHSAPILKRLGMPHYADGTLSDDEMDKIAEAFEKNAVAASKQLMLKLTNWSSSVPIVPSLGKAEAIGLSRGIANVLKDLLGEVKNPVNGDWTPVIRSAAAHMGVHLSALDIKRILNTIAHESGGNQRIPGIDDHDGTGRALGLLQYKRSTFDHYAVAGHHNILSGYDQLLALFNDSNWRGDLRWNGGWGPSGGRVRAANGAHFTSMTNALVGDNPEHDEYVINPYNASSVSLMKDAWRDMENAHPELRQDTSSANFNSQVVGLLKTVVSTIKSIDFAPEVNVDTMRKAINKQNAIDYRLM